MYLNNTHTLSILEWYPHPTLSSQTLLEFCEIFFCMCAQNKKWRLIRIFLEFFSMKISQIMDIGWNSWRNIFIMAAHLPYGLFTHDWFVYGTVSSMSPKAILFSELWNEFNFQIFRIQWKRISLHLMMEG